MSVILQDMYGQSIHVVIEEARSKMMKDPQGSLLLLEPEFEKALAEERYPDAVMLSHQLAIVHLLTGNPDKSQSLRKEALRLAMLSGDTMMIANSLTKIAKDQRRAGHPDSAALSCLKAIAYYKAVSSEGNAWACHTILGDIAFDAGRFEDTEQHYLEAWKTVQKLADKKDEFIVAGILQNHYLSTGQAAKYAEIIEQFLERNPYFSEEISPENAHYQSLLSLTNPKEESIANLRKSISMLNSQIHPTGYLTNMSRLGVLLTREGRIKEGADTLKRALQFASGSLPARMSLYYKLYENRLAANASREALMYLSKYYETRDSINSEKAQSHIRELQVQYDTKEKELALVQEQKLSQQRRTQRNYVIAASLALLLISGMGILFFWNRARMQRRIAAQNDAINFQKIQQLEQDKKILAMSSMIEGQEAERKRIAQDLHDGLGGLLSSVKAQLNIIQHHVEKLESTNLYHKANTLIDTASGELRRIAYNMMPTSLSRLGLQAALEDLSASLQQEHGLRINLQIIGLNGRLDETSEIMIYRMIQELCNNIVKHADATKVLIQVNHVDHEVFLVVEDNGKGFDPANPSVGNGIGMKSIESRVKFLNGTLDISSNAGSGTCVTINFPERA